MTTSKLYLRKRDYGPHLFVVPVRDLNTHLPFDGIIVGDIGPKMGFTGVDNGFMRFDHYRVPRVNMLMKYSTLSPEGVYTPAPHPKLAYGGMVLVRAGLVDDAYLIAAKSCIIATRYCTVRRQFSLDGGPKETQVIDYQMVQARLFTQVAQAFAVTFVGKEMIKMYRKMKEEFEVLNTDSLALVHSVSSGLKSYVTGCVADGVEECRKICGGHGYSLFSGLPTMYEQYVANCTLEGDNYLLTQQTAKFFLKELNKFLSGGKVFPLSAEMFNELETRQMNLVVNDESDLLKSENQLVILLRRTLNFLVYLAKKAQNGVEWNDLNIDVYHFSLSFSQYFTLKSFISECNQSPQSIRKYLKQLCDLYALSTIDNNIGDFVGFVSLDQSKKVKQARMSLYKALAPNILSIVESFDLCDYILDSSLGASDGRVYERLYRNALLNPVNQYPPIGYTEIKRILSLNKSKL